MIKTYYFKLLALAIVCCLGTTAFAQTQVTDSTSFATAFNVMKTSGGGTIELLNDISFVISTFRL
jgi:hypothetical protein